MKRHTNVIARFRIYPNGRHYPRNRHGRWFRVTVFRDNDAMLHHSKEIGLSNRGGFTARFIAHRNSKGMLGKLLFCQERLCAGAAVHEIIHAALYMMPKGRRDMFRKLKDEELFCRLVDSMTAQFWRCYKLKPKHGYYG